MNQFKNTIGICRLKHWMTKVKNVVVLFIILTPPLVSCGPAARAFWGEPQGPKYAVNLDGFWSNWWPENFEDYGITRNSGTDDYYWIIYPHNEIPSNYFLKVQINNYLQTIIAQSSEERYTFNGYVEYYVSETYPTVKSFFKEAYKRNTLNVFPRPQWVENTVKRKAKARITIEKFKKTPLILNCWFDDVGLAIDLTMINWK